MGLALIRSTSAECHFASMINWRVLPSRIYLALILEWKALRTPGCGVLYVWNKWLALFFNRSEIYFLGRKFRYQDRLAPFMIFDYVHEVAKTRSLFKFENRQLRVLEIGGNIGNWGICWLKQMPATDLYTFEPNPEPFEILRYNSHELKQWKIFNFGVGTADQKMKFYFIPQKSGQGSIYRENADKNLLGQFSVKETEVDIRKLDRSFCQNYLGGTHFDFIKIDVEGAEWEVLKGISDLTWHGMYVELNLSKGPNTLEQFIEVCRKNWPTFEVLEAQSYSNGNCDLFLKC